MSSNHDLNNNNNDHDHSHDDDDDSTKQVGVETSVDQDFAANNTKAEDYDHVHDKHDDENHDHDKHHDDDDVVKDVIFWRRRKLSAAVLMVATGVWVMLQLYGFNFVPLASWTFMAFSALLFSYGSFLRLLSKEVPHNMKSWEITEQRAKEMEESAKRVMEKGIRWMFHVTCEREWYIFLGVMSTLFLLAYVGQLVDLITLLYTGTMVGMTVPIVYVKKEDAIKSYAKKVKEQGTRMYHKFNDKVISKLHVQKKEKKEKKAE